MYNTPKFWKLLEVEIPRRKQPAQTKFGLFRARTIENNTCIKLYSDLICFTQALSKEKMHAAYFAAKHFFSKKMYLFYL